MTEKRDTQAPEGMKKVQLNNKGQEVEIYVPEDFDFTAWLDAELKKGKRSRAKKGQYESWQELTEWEKTKRLGKMRRGD